MAPGCFQTLQNTGGYGCVNKIYLIIYTGRYIILTLVRFKWALLLHHVSNLSMAKGQTFYYGLVRRPYVDKQQSMVYLTA
jgi:hypothetical protein